MEIIPVCHTFAAPIHLLGRDESWKWFFEGLVVKKMGSLDAIGNYDAIKKEIVMGGCMNIYVFGIPAIVFIGASNI